MANLQQKLSWYMEFLDQYIESPELFDDIASDEQAVEEAAAFAGVDLAMMFKKERGA